MKFYCIADEDTARGFRLAGIEGESVANPAEAEAALERAARQPGHRRAGTDRARPAQWSKEAGAMDRFDS